MGNLWSYSIAFRQSKSSTVYITDYDPINRFTELEDDNKPRLYTKIRNKYRNFFKCGTMEEKEKLREKS